MHAERRVGGRGMCMRWAWDVREMGVGWLVVAKIKMGG